MSERHACRLLGQWRRTQRYAAIQRIDEDALTEAIIALASEYGRYEYRRITALLQRDGWQVGKDRVQRIWRRVGLKVPQKQRPRRRLLLNDGSCIRLRPERANHVWSYDFVSAMTHDGRTLRMLTLTCADRPSNHQKQTMSASVVYVSHQPIEFRRNSRVVQGSRAKNLFHVYQID